MKKTDKFYLDGTWKLKLDYTDAGINKEWYGKTECFDDTFEVPGYIETQWKGYTKRRENNMAAFDYESYTPGLDGMTVSEYRGTFWISREFVLPDSYLNKSIWLCTEGIHPSSTIWIDGNLAGENRAGPYLPYEIIIDKFLNKNDTHIITICIKEEGRILQGVVKWPYFSGVCRYVYLETREKAYIANVCVDTYFDDEKIDIKVQIGGEYRDVPEICCLVEILDENDVPVMKDKILHKACNSVFLEKVIEVKNPVPWFTDSPYLYRYQVKLMTGGEILDQKEQKFGFREIKVDGKKLFFNKERLYVRSAGYVLYNKRDDVGPIYDKSAYIDLFKKIKGCGFNAVRFHTYPGSDVLFEAADELGILVQSELYSPLWQWEDERETTRFQWESMIKLHMNHPSLFCFSMGNEQDSPEPLYTEFRNELYDKAKELVHGVLVLNTDGTDIALSERGKTDFVSVYVNSIMTDYGRTAGSCLDIWRCSDYYVEKCDKPLMLHEYGYPATYPDIKNMERYGKRINPHWLKKELEMAEVKGNLDNLETFYENSVKIYKISARTALEGQRQTEDLLGHCWFLFQDYYHESGGMYDDFLNDKGIESSVWNGVNGDTVVLMRPYNGRYTLYDGGCLEFDLILSNQSRKAYKDSIVLLQLSNEYGYKKELEFRVNIDKASYRKLSSIKIDIPSLGKNCKWDLNSFIFNGNEIINQNEWNFWSFVKVENTRYSSVKYLKNFFVMDNYLNKFEIKGIYEMQLTGIGKENIIITPLLSPLCLDYLCDGGKVLLLPAFYRHGSTGLPMLTGNFNAAMSFDLGGTAQSNFGTIIDKEHPVFNGFPNDGYADLQFFDLLSGASYPLVNSPVWNSIPYVFNLDVYQKRVKPIFRLIPSYKTSDNQSYIMEVGIESGKLLCVSMRIVETLANRPESRFIFKNILDYMGSSEFNPEVCLSREEMEKVQVKSNVFGL